MNSSSFTLCTIPTCNSSILSSWPLLISFLKLSISTRSSRSESLGDGVLKCRSIALFTTSHLCLLKKKHASAFIKSCTSNFYHKLVAHEHFLFRNYSLWNVVIDECFLTHRNEKKILLYINFSINSYVMIYSLCWYCFDSGGGGLCSFTSKEWKRFTINKKKTCEELNTNYS